MPCRDVPIALDGPERTPIFATVCTRGARTPRRRCASCPCIGATRLCDIPIAGPARGGESPTCSASVCIVCAVRLGDDDICPLHAIPDEALAAAGRRR